MMMNEVRRVFALAIAGFGLGSMIVIVDSMFGPNLTLAATSDPYGPEPTGIDAPKRRRVLTERGGERRPEEQFQLDVFGRPLTIGGEIEIRSRYRDNPRIDPTRDSDAFRLRPGAELELFYALTPNVSAFAELNFTRDFGPTDLLSSRIDPAIEKVLVLLGQGTWHWRERNQIDEIFVESNVSNWGTTSKSRENGTHKNPWSLTV